jgi:hypothetical protein
MSPVHTKTERSKKGIKRGAGGKIMKVSPAKRSSRTKPTKKAV